MGHLFIFKNSDTKKSYGHLRFFSPQELLRLAGRGPARGPRASDPPQTPLVTISPPAEGRPELAPAPEAFDQDPFDHLSAEGSGTPTPPATGGADLRFFVWGRGPEPPEAGRPGGQPEVSDLPQPPSEPAWARPVSQNGL
jgi:hypothetical protein